MRTKIKKLTSVCLAVIMILGMLTVAPITAGAAEENAESVSATSGDFEYEVLDNDKISITAYFGSEANLTIPSTIDGYNVTEIGEYAFAKCTNLKSVTIPASLIIIGNCAFGYVYDEDSWDYVKDESFTIYGYTNSEAYAYARENGFKFVSLGEVSPFEYEVYDDVVASITDYNGSEANLTIPSEIDGYTVTEIGWSAFVNCTSLKSVEIPETVTHIGEYAFADCTNLKSVTIPASLINIGNCAFGYIFDADMWDYVKDDSFTIYGYTNSEAYAYARDNGFKFVSLGEVSPFLYEVYDDVAYITDYNGSEANLTIPSTIDGYNVTKIGWSAFKNCTSLKSVTIPDSVTYIGEYAFKNCTSLKSVEIPETVTYIGEYAFEDCTSLKSVTIPASVKYIGEYSFGYTFDDDSWEHIKSDSFTIYGYTNSEAYAYARENGFKFVSLGEVSPFEYEVYDDVASITDYNGSEANLTIPSTIDGYNVTKIGWSAFKNCTSLKSVTIPDSVTYIDGYAFENCTSLTSVEIPETVTYIGGYAFADCTNFKSVTIPASVKYIGEYALGYVYDEDPWGYVKVDNFTIYAYTNSEAYAYARENGFKFVSLGEVSPFEYEVYDDVASITDYNGSDANVTIPSTIDGYNVKEIGWSAFKNCTSLKSVEIPETVTYIGGYAFAECTNLKSVTIPASVKYIGEYAFADCTNLKSVTIPASLTNIGNCAFGYVYDEDSWDYVKDESFTIYGYTNSEADLYARVNDLKFVSLGEVSPFLYEVYDDVVSIIDYNGSEANLTIPSEIDGYTVTGIDWNAFVNCTSLTSVEIPETVTYIGGSAFENCTSLKSVEIPETVMYIYDYAFADCTNLKSVSIPEGVDYIGDGAFGYFYDEDSGEYVKGDNFTINGYTGSEAEKYAKENGFKFVSLGIDPTQKLGDVNGDGSISIDDATAVQKYLANMLDLTDRQAELADVNTDGDITIDDVTLVQKYLAGLAEI